MCRRRARAVMSEGFSRMIDEQWDCSEYLNLITKKEIDTHWGGDGSTHVRTWLVNKIGNKCEARKKCMSKLTHRQFYAIHHH